MSDFVFFYGTLMSGFRRPGRARLDVALRLVGRGFIQAALFDMGLYPAAIPATDGKVWGEVNEILDTDSVLATLDEIEGYNVHDPESGLYIRRKAPVILDDGGLKNAWVYFYNAPLGRAERIESGNYREHLKVK
jgi:gamma-glutamylcyclotransferase (GGCT)/AIG2-like uncharacterized protein YtfP